VEGTQILLKACQRNKVRHLIFSSSLDVYGKQRKGEITEESEPMPSDRYGYTKMLAEQEIMKSGVPYTIFRIATIYGPKTSFESSFYKMFRAIKEGKIIVIGSGKNNLTLVHIKDVVKAMSLAMEHPEVSKNQVYNLTDGNSYTQEALLALGAELLGAEKPKRHVSELIVKLLARQRNLDSDELRFLTSNRKVSTRKLENELGFRADFDARKGGRELVQMFLNKASAK